MPEIVKFCRYTSRIPIAPGMQIAEISLFGETTVIPPTNHKSMNKLRKQPN